MSPTSSSLQIDDFETNWRRFHPGRFPLGHMLRHADNWNGTRFHLLPDNRAAVASRAEFRALIERYNTMGTATLGADAQCWLVLVQSPNQDVKSRARMNRIKKRYDMQAGWQFFSATDNLSYTVWTAKVEWRENAFNRLLIQTYHQDIWDVLWMRASDGAIFYPYGSGVDVSQPTPQALIDLVSRYYGWLPVPGAGGYLKFNPKQMQDVRFEVSKPCADAINRLISGG